MSEQNLSLVRDVWEAFVEGLEAGNPHLPLDRGLVAPDAEWRPVRGWPGASSYVGRAGWKEFVDAWLEAFESYTVELEQLIPAGESTVLAIMHQSATGAGSGTPVGWRFAATFEIRDGRVVRIQNYAEVEVAVREQVLRIAAGLAMPLPRNSADLRPPPSPAPRLTGESLLDAVTEAMVALHKRYHHREPVTAKSLLLGDDLLACVLGGVYTDVEMTMIELQRTTIVQETRSAFQSAMQHKAIAAVERLSGRDVLAFISNQHVGPDLEIELFMLRPPSPGPEDPAPH